MLKDIIHLSCIYSCIGSEVLRAVFPFTLLDLLWFQCQYFLMTWFAHNATDGILFWPFFGIVFESDLKICIICILLLGYKMVVCS